MDKIISIDEIMSLYKQCNVVLKDDQNIRTEINKGTLNNKLNSTFNNSLSSILNVTFSDTTAIMNGGTQL